MSPDSSSPLESGVIGKWGPWAPYSWECGDSSPDFPSPAFHVRVWLCHFPGSMRISHFPEKIEILLVKMGTPFMIDSLLNTPGNRQQDGPGNKASTSEICTGFTHTCSYSSSRTTMATLAWAKLHSQTMS